MSTLNQAMTNPRPEPRNNGKQELRILFSGKLFRDSFLENGGTLEVPKMTRDGHDWWDMAIGPWGTLEVPKMTRDPFLENGENMDRDCHDRWDIALGPWGTLEVPKMTRDGHDRQDTALGPIQIKFQCHLPSSGSPNPLQKALCYLLSSNFIAWY